MTARRLISRTCLLSALVAGLLAAGAAHADEGMWTFDDFPSARLAAQHGAHIDDEWLDRVRLGVVRLSGCTASFVSPEGLMLTNHHCVQSCLAQHSSREASLIADGFAAPRRAEELRCGTQIADVLVATQDVTSDVEAATKGLDDVAANERRKDTLTLLEQQCEEAAQRAGEPRKCEAVTLYEGAQHFLYQYRRYPDVRLVFAPEAAIAAFGGDPDNFQFPRWCLDMALLRAYDANGLPAATPDHLRIDFGGAEPGELVFVAGHPGSTDRLLTVAQLRALRDRGLPPALLRASELRGRYMQFAKSGDSAERIVRDALNGLENTIKVQRRLLDALHDDAALAAKAADETRLRERHRATAPASSPDPWERVAIALEAEAALDLPHTFLEGAAGFNSRLFRYARSLVRAAAERPKPNIERLREYSDAALPRLLQQLGAPVPVYPELEELTLSFSLERMREWLGPDHPVVRRLLGAESPDALAATVVRGSRLGSPEERLRLWHGGQSAIDSAADPMIELARNVDAQARAVRKRYEDDVESVLDAAAAEIAAARFAALGTSVYPDATFTLRLSYGTVQGWSENGTQIQPVTRLERLYERATGRPPFELPERWLAARERLDPGLPFNLATNNDIVGGNSGSPLLDAGGNIVGLVFDGNIHSISGAYWFDAARNRAVAVHAAVIGVALRDVYGVEELVEEISINN
jgi:hypothetical protein